MEKSDSAGHIYAQREADTTGRLLRVILCAHLLRWKMAVHKTEIHFVEYFGRPKELELGNAALEFQHDFVRILIGGESHGVSDRDTNLTGPCKSSP
jgi:hypothetical protein